MQRNSFTIISAHIFFVFDNSQEMIDVASLSNVKERQVKFCNGELCLFYSLFCLVSKETAKEIRANKVESHIYWVRHK